MASFSRTHSDDLQDQLDSLRSELSAVRKEAAKRSYGAYREGRHMGEDALDMLRDYFESAAPAMRRNAHALEKTARDNPMTTIATAVVGVAVIGLAAAFFARR
jgi:ElaB/YqjD/DUF883 family membrane-anchored ribosome-binding protein